MTTTKSPKTPQIEASPALKAASEAKRPQPLWLQQQALTAPTSEMLPPITPERVSTAHRSPGQPRLLAKAEILDITGVSFPTIWAWMRAGKFPRSRIVGGKSMWFSTEVDAWLAALPVRPLKGDDEEVA